MTENHIQFILNQTTYTKEEAESLLSENNNDYELVIKKYLNPNYQPPKQKKLSVNQQKYKEIREMMDEVYRSYDKKKEAESQQNKS